MITEEDDGCGIPEDQLEAIQHSFEIQKTTGQDGIGLANLYNRLQILYEKPTNFKIASKEGAYTGLPLYFLPHLTIQKIFSKERNKTYVESIDYR